MNTHKTLRALVHRAATYNRPFNSQDSLLILKALHILRFRSNDIKYICEKCAFSITSARISVSIERAIDALNALASLQANSLPIVNDKLTQRLFEINVKNASPRDVQKAAVVIMKLGKRYCKCELADYILSVLIQFMHLNPKDITLRLAVISVYAYTSYAEKEEINIRNERDNNNNNDNNNLDSYLSAVLEAALFLVNSGVLKTLRGNSALQALHMFPLISRQTFIYKNEKYFSNNNNNNNNETKDAWERVGKLFREELQISTVVPGGYAQFLYDFLPSFFNLDANEDIINILKVICYESFYKGLNSYDVAKISMSLSHALSKWNPYSNSSQKIKKENLVNNNYNNNNNNNNNNKEKEKKEIFLLLMKVVKSLVAQLHYFNNTSWSLAGGGCVDQVSVGSVWRIMQKYICILQTINDKKILSSSSSILLLENEKEIIIRNNNNKEKEEKDLQNIMESLISLTKSISERLSNVFSWILYSMSMSARTILYSSNLENIIEELIIKSYLSQKSIKLSVRSSVQAIYAISILMIPNTEEKEILNRTSNNNYNYFINEQKKRQECINKRIKFWGPKHPLVENILKQLLQYRFREYPADDIPMLLQALSNIAEASKIKKLNLSKTTYELIERILHYLKGNINIEWRNKYSLSISSTLLNLMEFIPGNNNNNNNSQLHHVTKDFLYSMQSNNIIGISDISRLMENAISLKRQGLLSSWVREYMISLAAEQILNASIKNKEISIQLLLNGAELAHELGASITFVNCKNENIKNNNNNNERMTISLDLSKFINFNNNNNNNNNKENIIMTAVDAAQILRLMSYELQSEGMLYVKNDYIVKLRQIAIGELPSSMRVQTLLYLLRANANIRASKLLFDEKSLIDIMTAVCHNLIQQPSHDVKKNFSDASKIVHAFLSSQILLRLKKSLHSYNGLTEAIKNILDSMEAEKIEKPETIFQLRLLCGG